MKPISGALFVIKDLVFVKLVNQMGFDLSQYETVDERLHKWFEQNPNARVYTELISWSDTQFIVKASIYKNADDTYPIATGYAEERVGSSMVNKTSALENCETSSLGRALANAAVSAKGKRPSATEMSKVDRQETKPYNHIGGTPFQNEASEKQIAFVKTIVQDAFVNTGWNQKPEAIQFIPEWLGNPRTITSLNDLNKKEASRIINDKMGTTQGITSLEKFLQSKQPADRDPWETPKD
jgi:hypothetical protein